MSSRLTRLVPKGVRVGIKSLPLVSAVLNSRHSLQLARTSRRLDACLNEFVMLADMVDGLSLDGKTCLEIGSGYVLSHALAANILGAKTVIATDIASIAYLPALGVAVREAQDRIDWDELAPLGDVGEFKERFARLCKIRRFTLDSLGVLGIDYAAPTNLAVAPVGRPVDLVFSVSVLEHVPVADVPGLLANLSECLTEQGAMYHSVDLTDHEDRGLPFAFLAERGGSYGPEMQSGRGNRIRRSGWDSILAGIGGVEWRYLWDHSCADKPLPTTIDPSITYTSEADLRCASIAIYGTKRISV